MLALLKERKSSKFWTEILYIQSSYLNSYSELKDIIINYKAPIDWIEPSQKINYNIEKFDQLYGTKLTSELKCLRKCIEICIVSSQSKVIKTRKLLN